MAQPVFLLWKFEYTILKIKTILGESSNLVQLCHTLDLYASATHKIIYLSKLFWFAESHGEYHHRS